MRRSLAAIGVLSVALSVGLLASRSGVQANDYDSFCKLPDAAKKREVFLATTPETRATLVRTHLERWRDANKSRLQPKQIQLMGDLIRLATAEVYGPGPRTKAMTDRMNALEKRSSELLSSDDLQAIQLNSPCVAKSK